jgi:hypothetical protein
MLIKAGVPDMLEKDGIVLVESCWGGKGGKGADNMANFMRRVFPHAAPRGIYGVRTSYLENKLVFDEDGEIVDIEYDAPSYRTTVPFPALPLTPSGWTMVPRLGGEQDWLALHDAAKDRQSPEESL